LRETDLTSNSKRKAAMNVFMVRTRILSADQMKRTGTMITPSSRRAKVIIFSLRLDICLHFWLCVGKHLGQGQLTAGGATTTFTRHWAPLGCETCETRKITIIRPLSSRALVPLYVCDLRLWPCVPPFLYCKSFLLNAYVSRRSASCRIPTPYYPVPPDAISHSV